MRQVDDGVLICGGIAAFVWNACLLLSNGAWSRVSPLNENRQYAASALLDGAWWITGGLDGQYVLSTTEIRSSKGTWSRSSRLPRSMAGHCMVAISDTQVFLAGGSNGVATVFSATYLYSVGGGWETMEDMQTERYRHACSLRGNDKSTIVVAGGSDGNELLTSTEFFSVDTGKWQSGPALPRATYDAKMISVNGYTYHIGGFSTKRDVFRLDQDSAGSWKWTDIGSLYIDRYAFDIIPIQSMEECENWEGKK